MKLTIGMATYDDYDGVYFTAQAVRLYHPEVTEETEILVVDNNPDGPCAASLQKLADWIPGYRYLPNRDARGAAVSRDRVFREAQAPYVLCMDSHVLLVPGALKRFIAYCDAHPDCHDLLQGPLVYDDLKSISTHFNPIWSQGMYGIWATDERGKDPHHEPFEIPMQGLGVFACRKNAWLGFNPRFLGFGGEEGYIHEKFRQAGRRTVCLPFLRWLHRFVRPFGTRYPNTWEDRIRNYWIGWTELGLDTTALEVHFQEHLGAEVSMRAQSQVQAELANPLFYFDAIYCINVDSAQERWHAMQGRFKKLGILHRVRRFSAIETPESHHIGCTLSHRRIIEQAHKQQLRNVLIFEDDAVFLEDTLAHLEKSVTDLKTQAWHVFHLGGHKWGQQFPKAPGCTFLESPCVALTCAHAVAYNHLVYQRILDDVPNDTDEMKQWIRTHAAIDQYLQNIPQRYLSAPIVASQPPLLPQEDPVYREHFTL